MTTTAGGPALSQLADLALAEVRRVAGGRLEHADVRAGCEESESVSVRGDAAGDRVEAVSRSASTGVGVRVLLDGAWGFAAVSVVAGPDDDRLRPEDESAAVTAARQAVEVARASATVRRGPPVRLDETPPATGTYVTPHGRDPLEVPLAEKVDLLLAAAAGAHEAGDRLHHVEVSSDAWRRRYAFRSAAGASVDQTVLQVGGGLAAHALGGGEVQRRSYPNSFRGDFACAGWEHVERLALAESSAATAREAVALLDAPDLPTREGAVLLLDSSQLALQVHESIGHAVELDRVLGTERALAGTSWVDVADASTLRYGSDLVSVVADATTPGALGTFGYDDEGVPAGQETIIRDGVLEGFLTDREAAGGLGVRSNGTSRADSWGALPLIRMNNVNLLPGPDSSSTLDDLVAGTDDGVLLVTNKSWSIDDRRLDFQFGCEVAYEVRGGRLGQMFRNPVYSGRGPDFWRSCDALGGADDWQVWGVPNCGKGEPMQVARVAHGAPSGRFVADVRSR